MRKNRISIESSTTKATLTSWMYPSSGRILIIQRVAGSEGKPITVRFALWMAISSESSSTTIREPSGAASGVSW